MRRGSCSGPWWWRFVVGIVIAAALCACRVDLTVKVDSDELGSGRITVRAVLDVAAAMTFLGPRGTVSTSVPVDVASAVPSSVVAGTPTTTLAPVDRLRVDDLRRAGWTGPGLVGRADGSGVFALDHRFTTVAEANALLAQLSGPDGPFARLRLGRSRSPWATTVTLVGPGDFRGGLASFGDAKLGATTGGGAFGITEAEVLRQTRASKLSDVLSVRLDGQLLDSTSTWTFIPGATTPVALIARRTSWAAIASATAALLALMVFVLLRRHANKQAEVATVDPIKVSE